MIYLKLKGLLFRNTFIVIHNNRRMKAKSGEVVFWTSFKDELKACRILTLGVFFYTFVITLLFASSLIEGKVFWNILLTLPVVWVHVVPKRIGVCKEGIVRFGRIIRWKDLKIIGEENGKLVFQYEDLELRIPKDLVSIFMQNKDYSSNT